MKVKLNTYGKLSKFLGWETKEIEIQTLGATVADVLKTINLETGGTVYDLIIGERGVKDDYTILLDGMPLWDDLVLKRKIKDQTTITTMDILQPVGGG